MISRPLVNISVLLAREKSTSQIKGNICITATMIKTIHKSGFFVLFVFFVIYALLLLFPGLLSSRSAKILFSATVVIRQITIKITPIAFPYPYLKALNAC